MPLPQGPERPGGAETFFGLLSAARNHPFLVVQPCCKVRTLIFNCKIAVCMIRMEDGSCKLLVPPLRFAVNNCSPYQEPAIKPAFFAYFFQLNCVKSSLADAGRSIEVSSESTADYNHLFCDAQRSVATLTSSGARYRYRHG